MNINITALCTLLITGFALYGARPDGKIHEIKNAEMYKKIRKELVRPAVFVFNSATCEACKMMAKGLEAAAQKYPQIHFFVIADLKSDAFKDLPKELKIKGYPTTHLVKPKAEPLVERGSIEADELDQIIYKFVHGKPRPTPVQPKPVPTEPKKEPAKPAPAKRKTQAAK